MKRRWIKLSLILIGSVLALILVGFAWLVMDFGGRIASNRLIRKSYSPDRKFIAEVREVITTMHGGPDSVEVTLREATSEVGGVVYSQTYECGPDYSAFEIRWQSSSKLTIQNGMCDAGRYRSASDNKILRKLTTWRGTDISYQTSDHIAHATL